MAAACLATHRLQPHTETHTQTHTPTHLKCPLLFASDQICVARICMCSTPLLQHTSSSALYTTLSGWQLLLGMWLKACRASRHWLPRW